VAIFASDFFTLPAAAFKVASIFLRSPFNFLRSDFMFYAFGVRHRTGEYGKNFISFANKQPNKPRNKYLCLHFLTV